MISPFNSISQILDLWQFSLFGSKPSYATEFNANPKSNVWSNELNKTQNVWLNEMPSLSSLPSLQSLPSMPSMPSMPSHFFGQWPPKTLQNEEFSNKLNNINNNLLQNPFSFFN